MSHGLREPVVAGGLRAFVVLALAAVVSGWAGALRDSGSGLGNGAEFYVRRGWGCKRLAGV